MSANFDECVWPLHRTAELVDQLADRYALGVHGRQIAIETPDVEVTADRLDVWMRTAAAWRGFDVEHIVMGRAHAGDVLRDAAPAILRVERAGRDDVLVGLVGSAGRRVQFLCVDGAVRSLPIEEVRQEWHSPDERRFAELIGGVLDDAGVRDERRRRRVVTALRDESFALRHVGDGWLMREASGSPLRTHAKLLGTAGKAAALLLLHLVQYVLFILGWYFLGNAMTQHPGDATWIVPAFIAWGSSIAPRLGVSWLSSLLAIDVGILLKRRFLDGALAISSDAVRRQGAGSFWGQVIEADQLHQLAVQGTLGGVLSLVELCGTGVVLVLWGPTSFMALALVGWLFAVVIAVAVYLRRSRTWRDTRLHMTHELIDALVGHRTRLAQQRRELWHAEEDRDLAGYYARSVAMDRVGAFLLVFVSRGWMLVGLIGIVLLLLAGTPANAVAIAIGGLLLAYRSFETLTAAIVRLVGAGLAARDLGPLFKAGAFEAGRAASPRLALLADGQSRPGDTDIPVIRALEVAYRYPDRDRLALHPCSFELKAGDRVLIEGPSGGGKSTLATLLGGLRQPTAGTLLLRQLDQGSLGSAWHRKVTVVPAYNDNYLFFGPLSFNLLLGWDYPPARRDLRAAEQLCEQLDLGRLIASMPGGLEQPVGEVGWQLSHGERSRVFLARALLQRSDILVLDESFAALDPETLRTVMECVLARASTLVVIAHP